MHATLPPTLATAIHEVVYNQGYQDSAAYYTRIANRIYLRLFGMSLVDRQNRVTSRLSLIEDQYRLTKVGDQITRIIWQGTDPIMAVDQVLNTNPKNRYPDLGT
jgi:hypothetical protein